jgi:hypothetical protein
MRLCLFLLLLPCVVCAGPLDDYYLSRFAPPVKSAQLSATTTAATEHRHGDHCRTMLLLSLKKDWNKLQPETQQVLAKELARPALSAQKAFTSDHFTIYYATSGDDAPDLTDSDNNGTPEWVEDVARTFEEVYRAEVTQMGYRAPYVTSRYPVYLRNLAPASVYGYAHSEDTVAPGTNGVTSYIEIDKAFNPDVYYAPPLDSLQVTAAHEFHHAIQFGYNPSFEMWYGEATATWVEDEVYDDINQLYGYLDSYLLGSSPISLDAGIDGGSEYGRWIFNRSLAERHSPELIREIWEDLGKKPRQYADIPAIPVIDAVLARKGSSFIKEFSAFAGKVYGGDWSSHVDDVWAIPVVAPLETYSAYPVPASAQTLPKYAFAYYRFIPSATSPAHLKLNLSSLPTSATAVAYRKGKDGAVTSYVTDPQTGAITIPYFAVGQISEAVLAISSNDASSTFSFSTGVGVPPQRSLNVSFAGSGGGSINVVNSTGGGLSCTTGASCPAAQFVDNSVVTLYATPDSNSTFGGWSAPCSVTGNSCQLTLTSDVNVTATFTASPPLRILQGGSYGLISSAYAAATNGATIQARELTFSEALIFSRPVSISILGGYDVGYSTRTGFSTIDGSLRIRSGTLRANGLVLR